MTEYKNTHHSQWKSSKNDNRVQCASCESGTQGSAQTYVAQDTFCHGPMSCRGTACKLWQLVWS